MRISDWSSDVCSSDLVTPAALLSLDARGIGGIGLTQSGNGAGGTARVQVSGAGSSLSATQSFVDASGRGGGNRSEEHTSELQSLMRISYAVFCLKKKKKSTTRHS